MTSRDRKAARNADRSTGRESGEAQVLPLFPNGPAEPSASASPSGPVAAGDADPFGLGSEEDVEGLMAQMLDGFAPCVTARDPLDAELFVSGLVGSAAKIFAGLGAASVAEEPDGTNPDDTNPDGTNPDGVDMWAGFLEAVVAYAGSRESTFGLALLRILATVAPAPEVRAEAGAGARYLQERGVADPAWSDQLDDIEPAECWSLGDIFGDQESVMVSFVRPGRRHALMLLVDHGEFRGSAKDIWVGDDPSAVLSSMREQEGDPHMVLRELDLAEARSLLDAALADAGEEAILRDDLGFLGELDGEFAAGDADGSGEEDSFVQTWALAQARARTLPDTARPRYPGSEEPAELVSEFCASGVSDTSHQPRTIRSVAKRIAEHSAQIDRRPGRISPAKLQLFLEDVVMIGPRLSDAQNRAVVDVLPAWTSWAGVRAGVPAWAVTELVEFAQELFADPEVQDRLARRDRPGHSRWDDPSGWL